MQQLIDLITKHGPLLVFLNVLLEQAGFPVPAVPMLLVAGALCANGLLEWHSLLILVMIASGMANFAWFLAGRRYGAQIMAVMCRISISPDSCVRRTENIFVKWGMKAVVVARFIPGLSVIVPPLAGASGIGPIKFIFFDGLGTLIWAGAALSVGALFHQQVDPIIQALQQLGALSFLVIVSMFGLYLGYRWIQRQQLLRYVKKHRIHISELKALIDSGSAPVIIDVRSAVAFESDPRIIPGAINVDLNQVVFALANTMRDKKIILYCNCPNEASAARAAKILQKHGYFNVHPLLGGLNAWLLSYPEVGTPLAVGEEVRPHATHGSPIQL